MTDNLFESPLKIMLAEKIQKNRRTLVDWHLEHAKKAPPPFYCSVDLRDAGHKIAPVDSNLFPGGFNNICSEDVATSKAVFRAQIEAVTSHQNLPPPEKILVIPESHTTNGYYLENLYYLTEILRGAKFKVGIGWYGKPPQDDLSKPIALLSQEKHELKAFPIQVENGVLYTSSVNGEKFVPDFIILNNDFSGGHPKILDGVKQPIVPSHYLGWHTRKKSRHFYHYNRLAKEFADILKIDPWLIQVESEEVSPVNFNEEQGIDRVAQAVERVLNKTKTAYAERHITQEPFVFVKNDHGTYGMGIMMVHSPDELKKMNRRTKNKMSVGKSHLQIDSVIVQEGIPTSTIIDNNASEPVIYIVGCELIGGFLRSNTAKGKEENLNSEGMVFRKLCMSDIRDTKVRKKFNTANPEDEPILELVYGSIARLSALATGLELLELKA